MSRLLLVEEDPTISRPQLRALRDAGHAVALPATAMDGLRGALDDRPNLIVTGDGLRVDPRARRAELAGEPLDPTPREFDLLHHLAVHADEGPGLPAGVAGRGESRAGSTGVTGEVVSVDRDGGDGGDDDRNSRDDHGSRDDRGGDGRHDGRDDN